MVRMTGCTVIVTARMTDRPPMLTHSFDTPGGVDFRLVRVPRNECPPSPRPIFGWEEESIPRFAGAVRGHIPAYESDGAAACQPIGTVPQPAGPTHAYWEAMSGIANEKGLMIGESTCSSIFGAELRSSDGKGTALMSYMELSRIALERCARAREAVELMGGLAEEHGFAGCGLELGGSAESLAVVDAEEAWVMHLMPDQTGASAIWAAQRVPDGEAACVPNVFVIRQMDLQDTASFLLSRSALDTAERLGLWAEGEPFDFAAIFSAGEARHRYYSGRRQWRALSLLAPSLGLSPTYDDLLVGGGYPFSVRCDVSPTSRQLMAIMRDTYAGTPFDLGSDPAAGPFGGTDRFDAGNGAKAEPPEDGAFERPIGVYRMAYSYVCEASATSPRFHWAPHASQTSVYLPVLCAMPACPAPLASGSVRAIDRASAYWAFRIVKHTARGLPWKRCLEYISQRQARWEAEAAALVGGEAGDAPEALEALARAVVADWYALGDELLLRFGDGFEYAADDSGAWSSKPLVYPTEWLESVGFYRATSDRPPPPTVEWTAEKKRALREAEGGAKSK